MDVATPATAEDLRTLIDAWVDVRETRDRLDDLLRRASGVAEAVRWEAPSARGFEAAVDGVRGALRTAADVVDDAAGELGRAVSCGVVVP
jgi:hypothetical protein